MNPEKRNLRREMRARWEAAADRVRRDESFFRTLAEIMPRGLVFSYIGAGFEPDTSRFLRRWLRCGGQVCLPRCLPGYTMKLCLMPGEAGFTELETGAYALPQPPEHWKQAPDPDWILVPGLAFDREGYRLGRGGGYYDRYLAAHPEIPAVGLCDEACFLDAVPREAFDRPVDAVILPDRVWKRPLRSQ